MDSLEALRVLGLAANAGPDDIRIAYREMAKVWHPDRFAGDESLTLRAQREMTRLNTAYAALRAAGLLEARPDGVTQPTPASQAGAPPRPVTSEPPIPESQSAASRPAETAPSRTNNARPRDRGQDREDLVAALIAALVTLALLGLGLAVFKTTVVPSPSVGQRGVIANGMTGPAARPEPSGSGRARFFGVEAVGNNIAYIVDVSGSMAGPKIQALQRELERSIDGLSEHSSFYVALFSTDARPLGARTKWTDATLKNKQTASLLIRGIHAGGATNPAGAFEQIFELRPRPEAIYFLTDGVFAPEVASAVRQRNAVGGEIIPIHCIAVVSQEAEDIMRRLATDSNGTYTYFEKPPP